MEYTKGIPVCPYCKKPTRRQKLGSTKTSRYFPPIYDEEGNNTNPDRNTITVEYYCLECNKPYTVSGNIPEGFSYVNIKE